MGYSIFSNTMADMNYQQVEKAALENLPVLFPVAVIEEHGPHLCLGTDTYLTYYLCNRIRERLIELGTDCLIAPPYYWGINGATTGFAGSFTVKPETMTAVLCDSLECLKNWGFNNIFLFNFHGDRKQNAAIADIVKKAYEELKIGAYFVVGDTYLQRAGVPADAPYFIVQASEPEPPAEYIDIHAGAFETGFMVKNYPEIADADLARTLKSSRTRPEDMKVWRDGGQAARGVTPLGYCGDPSDFSMDKAVEFEESLIQGMPEAIYEFLKRV